MSKLTSMSIQQEMNNGNFYEAIRMANRYILNNGAENSQYEIYQLGLCYYATNQTAAALNCLKNTTADPVSRLELIEKLEERI